MHCPEIWNIKHPYDLLTFNVGNLQVDVPELIKSQFFNHSVSVVLPDTGTVPETLKNSILEDSDYYRINGLRVHELVNKEFIEAFVKKGQLSLLAINKKIDIHSTIALSPLGTLILSLVQEDYRQLGLEGKRCQEHSLYPRYVVTVDLTKDSFTPGKNNYERVRSCLEKRLCTPFDVIISWDPPEDKICPSSVAAWFHDHGYTVSLCHQKVFQRTVYSTKIPSLANHHNPRFDTFLDWLGLFCADGDSIQNEEVDKISQCSDTMLDVGQVQYFRCTGFFTNKKMIKIFNEMKKYVVSNEHLPWITVDVQGFIDSPVHFGYQEHTFHTEGNNSFTLIMRPDNTLVIRKCISSYLR